MKRPASRPSIVAMTSRVGIVGVLFVLVLFLCGGLSEGSADGDAPALKTGPEGRTAYVHLGIDKDARIRISNGRADAHRGVHNDARLTTLPLRVDSARSAAAPIPISFTLERAGYVTIVIDDEAGRRVRNLIQEHPFAAGSHTVYWDGYGEGRAAGLGHQGGRNFYDIVRQPVQPGTYHVRALIHDGITPIYEKSVQSPGSPPWHTEDRSGGWLADHSPPSDVAVRPEGGLVVVSRVNESGHGIVMLTEDGEKLSGVSHANNGFLVASNVAYDYGPEADPSVGFVMAAANVRGPNLSVNVRGKGHRFIDLETSSTRPEDLCGGVAVWNNVVAASAPAADAVYFLDASGSGRPQQIGRVSVTSPRGLYTDGTHLWVVTPTTLERFDVDWSKPGLGNRTTVVSSGLEDGRGITRDGDAWYITDWGSSHQVKVFNDAGEHLRTIGTAGGPQLGPYDETRMSRPNGLAVDSRGKLWVAEMAYIPKRLSRWDAETARFDTAWYGPARYSGTGSIDPENVDRFYYGANTGVVEFDLNFSENGGNPTPSRILLNTEAGSGRGLVERIVRGSNGQRYFTQPLGGVSRPPDQLRIMMEVGDRLRYVTYAERVSNWSVLNDPEGHPELHEEVEQLGVPRNRTMAIWSDLDLDGDPEAGEVSYIAGLERLRMALATDMSIVMANGGVIGPPTFNENRVPVYDLASYERLIDNRRGRHGDAPVLGNERWYIHGGGPIVGFDREEGEVKWTYHNQYAYGGPSAPLSDHSGQLISVFVAMGLPVETAHGESIFGLVGYHGESYLFTEDGFFVTTLLADSRIHPSWSFPEGEIGRGDPIGDIGPGNEHFWPTLNAVDGQVFAVVGKGHTSILRLDGLDTIRRKDLGAVEVLGEHVSDLEPSRLHPAETQGDNRHTISIASAQVDGDLAEWREGEFMVIDAAQGIHAAVRVDDDRLYGAFRTGIPDLLENSNEAGIEYLFSTGGAIDLLIGAAGAPPDRTTPAGGDRRLVVANAAGATVAAVYEGNERDGDRSVTYDSPVGTTTMARVEDVSHEIELVQSGGDIEISVSLSVLGLTPEEGDQIRADVGVIIGDGGDAIYRTYWNNASRTIASDLPGEARLHPDSWGTWSFGAPQEPDASSGDPPDR